MNKLIFFFIVLAVVIGTQSQLSAQIEEQVIDCPPLASVAAIKNGDWLPASTLSRDLKAVRMFKVGTQVYLVCEYDSSNPGFWFDLSEKAPEGFPTCTPKTDNKGFVCKNIQPVPNPKLLPGPPINLK